MHLTSQRVITLPRRPHTSTFPAVPHPSLFVRHLAVLFIAPILAFPLPAATRPVDSLEALQAAINKAQPGDTIVLKNGAYRTTGALTIAAAGKSDQPVVIAAETVGGVDLGGTHGFDVVSPAAHVIIRGFHFTHAAGTNTIRFGATHVRFTRNIFNCSGPGAELDVAGDDAEVDHNEFRDKKVIGNMLSVVGKDAQVARRLHVHHNYFHDYTNAHANGAETIRLGRSFFSMSRGDALVEYNLFVRCTGENELITNKSGGNTYRYNTFLESPGAQLTLRHGNECVVYGNYFRGTDGLRIFGDRHRVFSNYFEGNTLGINLGNGDGEVADGAQLTCHDRPDDCVIVFNTLIDNKVQYAMGGRKNGLGATRTTFANNLIVGGETTVKIDGPNPGAVWGGNLLWQTKGAGGLPEKTYLTTDPKLARDPQGIWHLSPASPAVDAATGEFAFVMVDQDGQPRTGKLDIGADEFSIAPIAARPLTPAEVGPASQ
jgi:poly(beta-D-mannuronate) lyase